MFLKIFANNNYNPYKGSNIVQLMDSAGNLFPAQILPLEKLDLSFLPKDMISYDLSYFQENSVSIFHKKPKQHFLNLSRFFSSYYVIANIPQDKTDPDLVYGYAEFSKDRSKGCLNMIRFFSSKYYEKDEKYNVKYFGKNMIAFAACLNDQIYGNTNQKVLYVPSIKKTGDGFYNKMNFIISRKLFWKTGTLTRTAANILFDR
jgi:hypothetical protein